ncbi:MAG: Type 1 glutamine amidotransferase-like domain-containing protein [Pyrinomonadaceae bacterium]
MKPQPQPIYLFADSQLLFWRDGGNLFLDSVVRLVTRDSPGAAYLGASNGDAPEYYSIFEAAMDGAGVRNCRMIPRSFPADARSFLSEADIILLAGGDVETGWDVFVETGMGELVVRRYHEGAVLMGVSAGAAQLGLYGLSERAASGAGPAETFGLVPFVIDAHDEGQGWGRLRRAVRHLSGAAKGIGIPAGGGLIYHPDRRVEAIRRPLHELSAEGGEVRDALLLPKPREGEKLVED